MYSKLCGDTTLKNVILVTNMWTTVSPKDGEAFEKELLGNAFNLALGKGAHMLRHDGTPESARDIIREITKNHPATLPIDKHKDTVDTTGEAINREPDEQTGRHQGELERAEEDVKRALRERDEMRKEMDGMRREKDEMRKQLEEGGRRLQEWMDGIKRHLERQEVRMEEMERESKKERERTEAELIDLRHCLQDVPSASAADRARSEQVEVEHNQQLADLNHHLRDTVNASAADQARLEQEMKERERIEVEHKQQLADLTLRLQHTERASAADRARLEQVEAEHSRQLADLNRRLRDEAAAHRAELEQEMEELRDCLATAVAMPSHALSYPTLYVQVFFSTIHDD